MPKERKRRPAPVRWSRPVLLREAQVPPRQGPGCGARRDAVRPGRPSERRFAGRVDAEQRDSAVAPERETVERESADAEISRDQNRRVFARVAARDRDRLIQLDRLCQRPLAVIFARGRPHEAGVDDEQITARVPLQQLDRAARHVGERWLLAARCDLVRESHFALAEKPEQPRSAPGRNAFEFGFGPDDLETVAAQLEDQIAAIGALSALRFGQKIPRRRRRARCRSSSRPPVAARSPSDLFRRA